MLLRAQVTQAMMCTHANSADLHGGALSTIVTAAEMLDVICRAAGAQTLQVGSSVELHLIGCRAAATLLFRACTSSEHTGCLAVGQLSFGRMPSCSHPAGEIDTSPLKQHQQKPPRSPESLKRSRESLEIPLALKLDVLAGPAQDSSFTTPRGAVQVGQSPLRPCTLSSRIAVQQHSTVSA